MTVRLTPGPSQVMQPEEWTEQAACANLAAEMFPSVRDAPGQREAKALCRRCPVALQCLEAGLAQDDLGRHEERWGIWGGLNGPQRGRLAARRGEVRKARAARRRPADNMASSLLGQQTG